MGEQYSGIGATYDSMTGLMDRMTFFGDVNEYRKRRVQCHIVLVQLSRLMQVNRKYGITVGDQLIRVFPCGLRNWTKRIKYTA